jgi:hypothetical protein
MPTRREVMTAGVIGPLASTTAPARTEAMDDLDRVVSEVRAVQLSVQRLNTSITEAARVTAGALADLRERFAVYLRTTGRFPEYIDVGVDVFYEAYDWHVRHQQPLQVSRQAGSRLALVFMYTQLVLRPEQERGFIGIPYDGA